MVCKEKFTVFLHYHNTLSQVHGHTLKTSTYSSPLLDVDNLKEELRACQVFHVDSEFERGRQKVFNYPVETMNTDIVIDKLNHFFNNLKCAAKVYLGFGFILKNLEDGLFRYVHAHDTIILCWIDHNFFAPKTI